MINFIKQMQSVMYYAMEKNIDSFLILYDKIFGESKIL